MPERSARRVFVKSRNILCNIINKQAVHFEGRNIVNKWPHQKYQSSNHTTTILITV